jgi:hypothetical protein
VVLPAGILKYLFEKAVKKKVPSLFILSSINKNLFSTWLDTAADGGCT